MERSRIKKSVVYMGILILGKVCDKSHRKKCGKPTPQEHDLKLRIGKHSLYGNYKSYVSTKHCELKHCDICSVKYFKINYGLRQEVVMILTLIIMVVDDIIKAMKRQIGVFIDRYRDTMYTQEYTN